MDFRYEPYVFISDKNMCKIIPNMTKVMDDQPVKNRQDLKPLDISITTQKYNKESTSELGVCIVLGVFIGRLNDIDDVRR